MLELKQASILNHMKLRVFTYLSFFSLVLMRIAYTTDHIFDEFRFNYFLDESGLFIFSKIFLVIFIIALAKQMIDVLKMFINLLKAKANLKDTDDMIVVFLSDITYFVFILFTIRMSIFVNYQYLTDEYIPYLKACGLYSYFVISILLIIVNVVAFLGKMYFIKKDKDKNRLKDKEVNQKQ